MAAHLHQHRPNRISVPQRNGGPPPPPPQLFSPAPTPTPKSKSQKNLSISKSKSKSNSNSIQLVFLFLFSLRSFYTLIPFLRTSPSSLSLFPFSFLVSFFSFILSLAFALRSDNIPSLSKSQTHLLFLKSSLLALVFLLRFQALRYCGTAALILADFSGNIVARVIFEGGRSMPKLRGFFYLFSAFVFLSFCWDRVECFPLSPSFVNKYGLLSYPRQINCLRIWPMLLPFLSGFLGCYERVTNNWGSLRQLGRKQVRLFSLFFTTLLLFIPAALSFIVYETGTAYGAVSIANLGWPLANTVVFGVLLSENYSDGKLVDFRREFFATFVCTIVLELFYFPELSLWGLLLCGALLYAAVRELDPSYMEIGVEPSESMSAQIMKPLRHILSERKSRKIALFLLINTAYMVVEFVAGFMSNSLGLISDACHMLFDCAALAIGLYASYISRLPANSEFNYGRGRFEVLSGYVNAVLLVLVGILIVLESFERILDPQEISTNSLLTVSIGGLLVNVVGLIFFHEEHHHAHGGSCSHSHEHHSHSLDDLHIHETHHGCITVSPECQGKTCSNSHDHHRNKHHEHGHHHEHHDHSHSHKDEHGHASDDHHDHSHSHEGVLANKKKHNDHMDHNMEGIFLHVLADTLGSVGVVISTLLIKYKGWLVADPACSIFISVLIVSSVIPLLRNSAEILLQRIPRAHEEELKGALNDVMKIKGVYGIHNMHVWSFTNSEVVATLHLHVSAETDKASTKAKVSHLLHHAGIKDLTLQLECVK